MHKFLILLTLCAPAMAQTLLVANQTDHSLSLINPITLDQTAALDVQGITGHEVAVVGSNIFVPIYGNSGVGRPGTDGDTIDVFDISSKKLFHQIKFSHGARPHCAIYDPHRDLLYVTTELDQTITLINPHTFQIVGTIPTGQQQSHMLVLSHDGRFGYTANVGPGTVSVLDLAARKTIAIIPISANTQRISISNDDRYVFTADQAKPQIAVVDTRTNKVARWIPVPSLAYGTALTHDGRYLLAALRTAAQVAVIDLKTMQVTKTLPVPAVPTEILIRPDGRFAYVSSPATGQVTAIDLKTLEPTRNVAAGKGADGLAWSK